MVSGVSFWLQGPSGDNSQGQRSGGIGRGGGDGIDSGKIKRCLFLSLFFAFFLMLKVISSLYTIKIEVRKTKLGHTTEPFCEKIWSFSCG